MCYYWSYRKETIETFGYSKVLIVCEKGSGLRNFKILKRNDNTIEIGFSIGPVEVATYNIYYKDYTEAISQAYYILDVVTGKIRRVQRVSANTTFPLGFKKAAISLCVRDNIMYEIVSREKEYAIKPYDEVTGEECAAYNDYWMNIKDLPKSIFELNFETGEVQKVHVVTFLH